MCRRPDRVARAGAYAPASRRQEPAGDGGGDDRRGTAQPQRRAAGGPAAAARTLLPEATGPAGALRGGGLGDVTGRPAHTTGSTKNSWSTRPAQAVCTASAPATVSPFTMPMHRLLPETRNR